MSRRRVEIPADTADLLLDEGLPPTISTGSLLVGMSLKIVDCLPRT